jgi:hypothetical protein
MSYVINTERQVINIPSGQVIANHTDFFPIKVQGFFVQMTDRKLYLISAFDKSISKTTIPIIENGDADITYQIQQFCGHIIMIGDKLYYCEPHNRFSYVMKGLDLGTNFNINNATFAKITYYSNEKYLFFVNESGHLMLVKNEHLFLLNVNIYCKYIYICDGYNYNNNFVVILYNNHTICIQIYKNVNSYYKLIQEKMFSVDIYIDKIYGSYEIIDNLGNVYNYNFYDLLCYYPNCSVFISNTNIVINKIECNDPIKEIFVVEYEKYYLSYNGNLFRKYSRVTTLTDIIGSKVSITNTKSAKNQHY